MGGIASLDDLCRECLKYLRWSLLGPNSAKITLYLFGFVCRGHPRSAGRSCGAGSPAPCDMIIHVASCLHASVKLIWPSSMLVGGRKPSSLERCPEVVDLVIHCRHISFLLLLGSHVWVPGSLCAFPFAFAAFVEVLLDKLAEAWQASTNDGKKKQRWQAKRLRFFFLWPPLLWMG